MYTLFCFFDLLKIVVLNADIFNIDNITIIVFNTQYSDNNDLLLQLQQLDNYSPLSSICNIHLDNADRYIYVNDTENLNDFNKYIHFLVEKNNNPKFLIDYRDIQNIKNISYEKVHISFGYQFIFVQILIIILMYFIITYLLKQIIIILPIIRLSTVKKIQSLKKIKFSELPNIQSRECIVCLDKFLANDDIRMLPCCHYFHPHCVDIWLGLSNDNCPVCRVSTSIK